jgi:hypothetical protein
MNRIRKLYRPLILLILLGSGMISFPLVAQVGVEARLVKNRVLVGDPVPLQVQVDMPPAGVQVILPDLAFTDSIAQLEILDQSPWDTVRQGKILTLQKTFTLTAWDSGYVEIPRFGVPFSYQNVEDTVYTKPIGFLALTVPPDTVLLRPLKPIVEEPIDWRDLWPYGLGVLITLLFLLITWWYLRRRSRKDIKEVPLVEPLPHELALQKLDQLEAAQLWQAGKVKEYHSQLTFILREYLENRFNIQALEQTSTEILRQLDQFSGEQTQQDQLRRLFQTADMVKFAKATPPEELHTQFLDSARAWILDTVPQPEPEENPTNE